MKTAIPILFFIILANVTAAQTMLPDFSIVSIDDSSRLISKESLFGKVYLVDFWATWCPPCVEEIPELTRVYKKYRDRDFEIVSLSFDKSPERVRTFREKRFPMPWLHGFLEHGFGSYIVQNFDVENIPHILLVDRGGKIVATEDELRGEQLEKTLLKYIR